MNVAVDKHLHQYMQHWDVGLIGDSSRSKCIISAKTDNLPNYERTFYYPVGEFDLEACGQADALIIDNYRAIYQTIFKLRTMRISIPVYRGLLPIRSNVKIANNVMIPECSAEASRLITGYQTGANSGHTCLHIPHGPYICKHVLGAAMAGLKIICTNDDPITEYADTESIDKFNIGQFADDKIPRIDDDKLKVAIENIINGRAYNYNNCSELEIRGMRWVVNPPKIYNRDFSVLHIKTFDEAIKFFANKIVDEVYIFNCEFGDADDMVIHRLLWTTQKMRALGIGRRVHFCVDKWPEKYKPIRPFVSVISIEEGKKQIT